MMLKCAHYTHQTDYTYSEDLRVIGILVEDLAQLNDERRQNETFVEFYCHVTCTHVLATRRLVSPRRNDVRVRLIRHGHTHETKESQTLTGALVHFNNLQAS